MKEVTEHNQTTLRTNYRGGFNLLQMLKKRIKNEKGLTLVELLAVVVILAIIAAIAIPAIGNIIENNRGKALVSDVVNVMNAANIYFTENGEKDEVKLEELREGGYLESQGKLTEATVKNEAGKPYTVTAKGENGNVSLDITDKSLQEIVDAKVSVKDGKVELTSNQPSNQP